MVYTRNMENKVKEIRMGIIYTELGSQNRIMTAKIHKAMMIKEKRMEYSKDV